MHIKWSFIFGNQHIPVITTEEAEDKRIQEAVDIFDDLLYIASTGRQAYINLKQCTAIFREEVKEESVLPEKAPSDESVGKN